MVFPPPFAFARLGEAFSDRRNANTIAQWQYCAKGLEYRLERYHEEYNQLMEYTAQLKALYSKVTEDAFPPAGIITSLGARLKGINFFQSGSKIPAKENRVYSASFPEMKERERTGSVKERERTGSVKERERTGSALEK